VLFIVVGWLIVTFCSLGTWAFMGGVADIAPKFEPRVRNWGLGGATVVAAAVAFGGLRAQWYWCVLFVLGAAFGCMLLGVFVTPEKLLVKWKEETRAEAENLAYAERQMGR
jgi:predicted tellurium resistance membrane protein TerC